MCVCVCVYLKKRERQTDQFDFEQHINTGAVSVCCRCPSPAVSQKLLKSLAGGRSMAAPTRRREAKGRELTMCIIIYMSYLQCNISEDVDICSD